MSDKMDRQRGQQSPEGGPKPHQSNMMSYNDTKNAPDVQIQPRRNEERRLILKLDVLILIFVFLAYWAKVLDQSATSASYVSSMKEDLKLFGNELNHLNANMHGWMTRFSASHFIPAAELIWGVLTLAQYKVTNGHQLYVIRFFVGAAESKRW
ncbi:Major facilitator superfamily domain, general substrate transporter [Metarhizium rileyi]|uniref:Major facilitator superfamily domain, general substrate transporter n=1 Tax=Metarhizium rileyi (strain RCEF 4871) TaxID=1649241 RepID=A0A167EBT0_METRR|nr:Major facilitator superfamily domain, general substrate transporter [Metarhizium rileyi RCEF 4871]